MPAGAHLGPYCLWWAPTDISATVLWLDLSLLWLWDALQQQPLEPLAKQDLSQVLDTWHSEGQTARSQIEPGGSVEGLCFYWGQDGVPKVLWGSSSGQLSKLSRAFQKGKFMSGGGLLPYQVSSLLAVAYRVGKSKVTVVSTQNKVYCCVSILPRRHQWLCQATIMKHL